ncbi:hypothetical protein [Pseudophaeobacter sp.]|uniref:DUF6985 domain-containing protein n=1 Tax=Pseudophaeobacter sp. TaxID=1971739 RepID=UPI003298EDB9
MEFFFDRYFWQAQLQSEDWAAFTGGTAILLTFAPEGRGESPLRADERALADWVERNLAQQKPHVLAAIYQAYPDLRQQFFVDFDIEENIQDLPSLETMQDLVQVIDLIGVNVHQISNDGIPYVGYEFSCAWDEEHGLGVLMHRDRIVELGAADVAMTLWMVEEDLDADGS